MPAANNLSETVIDTGNIYQDTVSNIHQLILEHLSDLTVQGKSLSANYVVKYDEIKVFHTPFISIVFDGAKVVDTKMNNCLTIGTDIIIYFYFQSLNFGVDTYPFIGALYKLAEMFIVHFDLYGYTKGTSGNVQINESALVGRRLDNDVLLTGQLNLTINRRSCNNDHA